MMPFPTVPTAHSRRPARSRARLLAVLGAVALPLALGGCSMFGSGDDEPDLTAGFQPCPPIGVLQDADRVTVFNGRGMDITDVVMRAEIRKAVTKCEYDKGDGVISVDLAFDGKAELGPAATSRNMTLRAFVTVARPDGRIVNKKVYDLPVAFEGAARQVGFLKTVEGTELPYNERVNGASYEILVGFQLTREQLDYNRKVGTAPLR